MEWQDQSWLQSHYIGDDGSNNNVGPNDGDGVHTNDSNCVGDDADTDGDNNNNINDGDKNYGGSNYERGGGDDEGGDNADLCAKVGGRDDRDDKDDIDFEDDVVKGEFHGSIRCK